MKCYNKECKSGLNIDNKCESVEASYFNNCTGRKKTEGIMGKEEIKAMADSIGVNPEFIDHVIKKYGEDMVDVVVNKAVQLRKQEIAEKNFLAKCECYCSMIEIEKDKETNQYNIALWGHSHGNYSLSIKERIRWCWRMLTTGNLWTDHTILSAEKAKELKDWLEENLK